MQSTNGSLKLHLGKAATRRILAKTSQSVSQWCAVVVHAHGMELLGPECIRHVSHGANSDLLYELPHLHMQVKFRADGWWVHSNYHALPRSDDDEEC